MATQHTPAGDRQQQGDFQGPPPVIAMNPPPALMMSPDQLKTLIDSYNVQGARGAAAAAPEEDFPNVSLVAVKLPTFWTHDPDLWFLQTEAVFASRVPAVTRDGTKFNHCVTALPSDALNACKNIIRLPPTSPNRYQLLKDTLITTYGKTPAQKHVESVSYTHLTLPTIYSV